MNRKGVSLKETRVIPFLIPCVFRSSKKRIHRLIKRSVKHGVTISETTKNDDFRHMVTATHGQNWGAEGNIDQPPSSSSNCLSPQEKRETMSSSEIDSL